MTVGTTINIAKPTTDGLVTEFPFSFKVFDKAHLRVVLRNADGTISKTYAQNEFSVSGLGENAGTVTVIPAPASGKELLIWREVPITQDTDIVNQGGFFPEVIEKQLDLLVMQTQQLNEALGRAIVSDIGDPAYSLGRIAEGEVVQLTDGKLQGLTVAELSAPALAAAAEAQGIVAALVTYTFGYIGIDDDTPPTGVGDGEGYVYTMDGRVFGAINDGGVADVKFELLTKALADEGGPGNGTVVSVAASGGTTGLTFSGGPITGSGTLKLGGTLAVANGGTGATTAAGARAALSAAKSGANEDITSLRQSTEVAATGTATPTSIGYMGLPLSGRSQGSNIVLALADLSKLTMNTAGGWTIPANAALPIPVGSWFCGFNDSGSSQTLSINTDTLLWAGTTNTGSRTVLPNGRFMAHKIKPTVWLVDGNIS